MDKNIERIERYLEGIVPPVHESDQHRQQLRRQVLTGLERRPIMSVKARAWRIVAATAALVCTGAIAATIGVKIHRFYFEGVDKDGRYLFSTGPQTAYEGTYQDANGVEHSVVVTTSRTVSMDSDDANGASVEQMQSDLEEIEALRQQDARELVGVIDQEVNGHPWRVCRFKYVLADGRTHTMNESDPDKDKPRTGVQIEQDHAEAARLRAQGVRDVVKVIDTDVEGQTARTLICRYVLGDGREMTIGESDPAWPEPTRRLSEEQINETWRLKGLDEGEALEPAEETAYGKTFVFERRRITLGDGTVVTLSVGEVKDAKESLTKEDWQELHGLIEADGGEFLGTYEQQIKGKVFTFERRRYTLSDGTQIIRANGKPRESQ